ncbi:TerC family protein [Longimicrobium sp.]|uniref:TerC family protein n=1 Tax=Longimicrobium sp. TaxID=2029185 RepID=UPI002E353721|nr:TerC family protein [Longimicrobium sp.]HEX6039460.1 TerC family protein [Longimicrobium sp.]
MADSIWLWVGFNAAVLVMLALDLGVFHRKAHAVSMREAAGWTAVWVSLAMVFNAGIWYFAGPQPALEFLTGYLVEKSLAVDNIFVIALIFSYFSVPAMYQHRVLFWGILGALVMRGAFIAAGSYVLHQWHWVIYVFGGILLVTGIKMALRKDEAIDPEHNPVVRLARRWLPLTHRYDGQKFWSVENGRRVATPLFLVLLLVEFTDLVFAIDSIPAIFAITDDPFLVYTSNVMAILGLRSMYFLLAGVVHKFVYLKFGLSLVLVFVGGKMMLVDFVKVPTLVSLGVIATVIGGSIALSLLRPPKEGVPPPPLGQDAPDPEADDDARPTAA